MIVTKKSVQIILLLLSLMIATSAFAQEETPAPSPSMESNNLYLVEHQWGSDPDWHDGGLWVLGGREGQPIDAMNISSSDEGATLEGDITYSGEGPIAFHATQEVANVYSVEVQWGSDTSWHPQGLWLIGARDNQQIVSASLSVSDEGKLVGDVTYAGEGPIAFMGTPIDGGVYYTQNQWGGDDAEWNPGGIWVIGGRPDQQVAAVTAESSDEGMTLEGEMTYEGEGSIAFRATSLVPHVYVVENQWGGADAEWNPGGYSLLGNRPDQALVALDLAMNEDGTLSGTITYAGEGPINFTGTPLNSWNLEASTEG